MKTKTILATSLAAVFLIVMGISQVYAVSSAFEIQSASGTTITTVGNIGTAVEGHAVIVYAIVTDETPTAPGATLVAYLGTVHPSFNDNPNQAPGNKVIHGHKVQLDSNLCVVAINNDPTVTSTKNSVTVNGVNGNPVLYAIAGYDVTSGGLCPTEIYDTA